MHLIYRWRKLSGISVLFYLKGINCSQLPLMYVLKGQIKFFVDKICSYNYFLPQNDPPLRLTFRYLSIILLGWIIPLSYRQWPCFKRG